ncbi:MAG: hypothetical protein N2515_11170, partial [Deltaproteobacteria bacterium]|nr:hypothetical protein [Deltaproteobacteria bacterium]
MAWAITAGCQSWAFEVARVRPPIIDPKEEGPVELEISADPRIREALRKEVLELVPAFRASKKPPSLRVEVLVERKQRERPAWVRSPLWRCDPIEGCLPRDLPQLVDVPEIEWVAWVRIENQWGQLRYASPPIRLHESGDNPIWLENRLVTKLARRIAEIFEARVEWLRLPIPPIEDEKLRSIIESARVEPTQRACEALEAAGEEARGAEVQSQIHLAAGQCWAALAFSQGARHKLPSGTNPQWLERASACPVSYTH